MSKKLNESQIGETLENHTKTHHNKITKKNNWCPNQTKTLQKEIMDQIAQKQRHKDLWENNCKSNPIIYGKEMHYD